MALRICMRLSLRRLHTWTSLATRSRKSGYALSKNIPREGPLTPQISPLRSFGAPVEMTKGRAALPLSVVAEQNPFPGKDRWTADLSTTLLRSSGLDDKGEEAALPLSVVAEQNPLPGKDRWTADLSTTLLRSSGRDDKGEGGASIECGCRTESLAESLANTKELSSRRFVRGKGTSSRGPR